MVFKMPVPKHGEDAREYKRVPIACDCWFTTSGKSIPRFFRYEDEAGIRHTVSEIQLLKSQKRNMAAIPVMMYDCVAMIEGVSYQIILYHYTESGKWEAGLKI